MEKCKDNTVRWSRTCGLSNHGGRDSCWNGYVKAGDALVVSFNTNDLKLNASEAVSYCNSTNNFRLWSEMSWPLGDKKWMAGQVNGAQILVGLSDKDKEGVWLDYKGVDVTDLITWKDGEPNNDENFNLS